MVSLYIRLSAVDLCRPFSATVASSISLRTPTVLRYDQPVKKEERIRSAFTVQGHASVPPSATFMRRPIPLNAHGRCVYCTCHTLPVATRQPSFTRYRCHAVTENCQSTTRCWTQVTSYFRWGREGWCSRFLQMVG